MGRTLVIGDIHGGMRALHQAFERASVNKKDKLVFLGDYVDSWSESPQVLDFLISTAATNVCVFIRGNHDALLLEWLRGKDNELWHQHGGAATMKAYFRLSAEAKLLHIHFLQSLQNYHIDKKNRLYIHAGFTNMHGVEYEQYPKLLFWDRTLWEMAVGLDKNLSRGDAAYPRRLQLYKEIYIGHTPVTKIGHTVPVNMANVWNIDTGAAFKGPLTIIDADTKQFWQSDPLPSLYPTEKGRN